MPAFKTFSEAAGYIARNRERRQIWGIASIEGTIYYPLLSQPNLGGYSYNHATKMLAVNDELLERNSPHQTRRDRANTLKSLLEGAAEDRGVIQNDRHAEELFLENWSNIKRIFAQHRQRAPKKLDLFLSHSPCSTRDRSPSPQRNLDGTTYPSSCTKKLQQFIRYHSSIKITVYYLNKFGVQERMTPLELKAFYKSNDIIINSFDSILQQVSQEII